MILVVPILGTYDACICANDFLSELKSREAIKLVDMLFLCWGEMLLLNRARRESLITEKRRAEVDIGGIGYHGSAHP